MPVSDRGGVSVLTRLLVNSCTIFAAKHVIALLQAGYFAFLCQTGLCWLAILLNSVCFLAPSNFHKKITHLCTAGNMYSVPLCNIQTFSLSLVHTLSFLSSICRQKKKGLGTRLPPDSLYPCIHPSLPILLFIN